jgi:hypothetical protein
VTAGGVLDDVGWARLADSPGMHSNETYSIRRARDDDTWALRWLAELDSQRPLHGPALIGEIDGIPAAAISLTDGRVAADPFQATAVLPQMMRVRADALRAPSGASSARSPLAFRPLIRTSNASTR